MNTTDLYNMTVISETISSMHTTDVYNMASTDENHAPRRYIWQWRVGLFAVGGACIECVGVICNIIAIIVLANFRSRSSAPFLLICLSVFDSLYLLSMLFLENLAIMEGGQLFNASYREFTLPIYDFEFKSIVLVFSRVLYPTPFLMQTCTIYLVVLITLERFAVVAWPFVAHRICRNDFGRSTFYTEIFIKRLNIIVNFALPFVLLILFNYFMIISLRKSRMNATSKRTFTTDERRMTMMVFCMTSIFFVCELVAAICQIVLMGFSSYDQLPVEISRFSAIADTCLLINSAINFAIYCVSGKKFRQTFVQLFCRCRSKPHKKQPFCVISGSKTGVNSCLTRTRKPRRSTTESSLSSISNGTRSSKCTDSDSIHKKLSVIAPEG
ncbi:unnamed protein product [Candidula unifasciata]|uniref:G-protein coupled receptors family 1 profile domain-containing protein n=1 Tax=Candidula unifasciata TaxID=100452 RepID=A0A8S3ZC27_9EUPU|nr:unnamed protein product [Candidula unifasciata]